MFVFDAKILMQR